MNHWKNKAVPLFICFLFFTLQLHSGCIAASYLKGAPGTDVASIKPGIRRAEAEKVLGPPLREWDTPLNIHYCIYSYDAGIPPSTGDAVAMGFFEVISVGFMDLLEAMTDYDKKTREIYRKYEQMAVAYDSAGTIVGVFDHLGAFDALPADGRSP